MPPTTANLDQGTGRFTNRQQVINRENNRALAELAMAIPSNTLTKLVSKATSDQNSLKDVLIQHLKR